jgi:two-component system phosphate regulon sensor histidine kinase PhoR
MKKKDFLIVKINNYGLVIPADEQKKIFERNYRTDDAKEIFEQGTGIGLSLVKHICDFIKGECYVESSHEKTGTVFVVKVPIYFKIKEII